MFKRVGPAPCVWWAAYAVRECFDGVALGSVDTTSPNSALPRQETLRPAATGNNRMSDLVANIATN